MMCCVSPETCWAIKKHWNNKFYYSVASSWFFLRVFKANCLLPLSRPQVWSHSLKFTIRLSVSSSRLLRDGPIWLLLLANCCSRQHLLTEHCAVCQTGSTMFTICSYNILTFFCQHNVFMCSVWIWEQTAIISLYNINWPVFIAETESVYCVVRPGSVTVIKADLVFKPPVPWLRRSNAGLLLRLLAFSPRSVHMRFVVDKVALQKISVPVLRFLRRQTGDASES
jgi:hypothetical protein